MGVGHSLMPVLAASVVRLTDRNIKEEFARSFNFILPSGYKLTQQTSIELFGRFYESASYEALINILLAKRHCNMHSTCQQAMP
jgi:hypothetical protein